MAESASVETTEDFGQNPQSEVKRWLAEIKAYDGQFEKWTKRSNKIVKRYRDEETTNELKETPRRFNILWANIQTLGPALFAKTPNPDVSRRFKDRDPIGRAAALILERSLAYCVDTYDFSEHVMASRDDYLLTARGQAWVRYVPTYGTEQEQRIDLTQTERGYEDEDGNLAEQKDVLFDGEAAYRETTFRPVEYEEAVCDHIAWKDFGHTPAPKWDKVTAVWKKERLTRDQLKERFGNEIGGKVKLTETIHGIKDEDAAGFGDVFKRAVVYEIWDKTKKEAVWISPGYTEAALDKKPDPLKLEGFFPCPKPVYGTMTTDTLIPVPDYIQYQSQALELDNLTQRIHLLTKALRVVGVYDQELTELERLIEGDDNQMVAVSNWAMFAEKGGIDGAVSFFPIKEIAEVLIGLSNARQQMKQDLYEISGISDIVRGQVDPREKLGQSQLKGQFATLRLQDRQAEMNRFVRDLLRIKGEIIAEHFDPKAILTMSGWMETIEAKQLDKARKDAAEAYQKAQQEYKAALDQAIAAQQAGQEVQPPQPLQAPEIPPSAMEVFQQAVALLRDDKLRTFRVDIETDSTAFEDKASEKESRVELLTAAGQFLDRAVAAGQIEPRLTPLMGELLLFGLRGFNAGKHVEALFEEALEELRTQPAKQQDSGQAQADAMKAQVEAGKLQVEQMRLQMQQAADQAKSQIEQMQFQHNSQLETAKFQSEEADKNHARKMEEHKAFMERARVEDEQRMTTAKIADMQEGRDLEATKIADAQQARHEQQSIDQQNRAEERNSEDI